MICLPIYYSFINPHFFFPNHRSDIECSLHLGTPTHFALDQVEPLLSVNALTPPRTSVFLDDTARSCYSNSLFLLNLLLRDATQIARLLTAAVTAAAAASVTASHDPPGTAAAAATTTTTMTTTATTCRLSSASVHDTFILLGYRVQAVASSLHLLQTPLLPRAGAEEAEEEHQRKRFINPATSTNPTNDEGAHANNNGSSSSSSSRTATDPIQRALCAGLAAFVGSFFWTTGGGENRFPVPWLAALAREVSWEAAAATRTAPAEIALWVLLVCVSAGVFAAEEEEEEEWLVAETRELAAALGLGPSGGSGGGGGSSDTGWERVRGQILAAGLPWIEPLHERRARAHWERCVGGVRL
ncbi:uncharacterized protein P884DRAFT_255951, partial [Thermothelomyces heterothallicus CBS 202.75]|uniref:uncharacterized protein n=1 Tax=Thermothelomyces heterothallicus CBS 202.75 TaxID=1149848 RepID=UPI0037435A38